MRTHSPWLQRSNGSYQRFDRLSPPTAALRIPDRVLRLGGGDIPSHAVRTDDESEVVRPPDIEPSLMPGRDKLMKLAGQLRLSLSAKYPWFGQENMKVIGTQPVDVGGSSSVWMGRTGGRTVAIKTFRYCISADGALIYERFENEALVCSHLSDQKIVRFLGVYSTPAHPFALVFEFMVHLSLREYLSNNCDVRRLDLVLEIAYAIKHLHTRDIIHGNLSISNILVDAEGHIRVAGFGAASTPFTTSRIDVDRLFYGAAPELVDPQLFRTTGAGATKASDMYAFGILVWEVFAGTVPFPDENRVEVVYSMLKGSRPARPDHFELSDRVWKVVKGCWQGNPAKRMAIVEVLTILNEEANVHNSY